MVEKKRFTLVRACCLAVFFSVNSASQASPILSEPILVSVSDTALGNQPEPVYSVGAMADSSGELTVFTSPSNDLAVQENGGWDNVFIRNSRTQSTLMVSGPENGGAPNGSSNQPSISSDGKRVAFWTQATNLLSAGNTGIEEVFVYDVDSTALQLASVAWDGGLANSSSYGPYISANGRFVAFTSAATNLVEGWSRSGHHVFVRDLQEQETIGIIPTIDGMLLEGSCGAAPKLSGDGSVVVFQCSDGLLYAHEMASGQMELVSKSSVGDPADSESQVGSLSYDARYIAFRSIAKNLSDTVVPDLPFWQHFVHDRSLQTTEIISVNNAGVASNGQSFSFPSISSDGRFVSFSTQADNHEVAPPNTSVQAFVRDRIEARTIWISQSPPGFDNYGQNPYIFGSTSGVLFFGVGHPPEGDPQFGLVQRFFISDDVFKDSFER